MIFVPILAVLKAHGFAVKPLLPDPSHKTRKLCGVLLPVFEKRRRDYVLCRQPRAVSGARSCGSRFTSTGGTEALSSPSRLRKRKKKASRDTLAKVGDSFSSWRFVFTGKRSDWKGTLNPQNQLHPVVKACLIRLPTISNGRAMPLTVHRYLARSAGERRAPDAIQLVVASLPFANGATHSLLFSRSWSFSAWSRTKVAQLS